MPILQRTWLAAIAAALMTVSVQAQTPAGDSRITLVVPIAPGGGVDAIGRLIAEKLQERLKQPVVVENRVGAGGAVGADSVAKAAPDGRTLLLIETSSILHKWLHKNVPFDVISPVRSRECSGSLQPADLAGDGGQPRDRRCYVAVPVRRRRFPPSDGR
jgi:tripartite-type tricarboxylate transporter receptor subunit TctC